MGNVKWDATAALVFDPALQGLSCSTTKAANADPATGDFATSHVLLVGHKVVCTASYAFTQAVFEALATSSKVFTVGLPAGRPTPGWAYKNEAAQVSTQQTVTVDATIIRSFQALFGTCTPPANATSECVFASHGRWRKTRLDTANDGKIGHSQRRQNPTLMNHNKMATRLPL